MTEMQYQVKLTRQAIEQIRETRDYIANFLSEPETAQRWMENLRREFAKLYTMPLRFPLTEEEPWRTKGIRKMTVRNFLVYYNVDEDRETVWIIAVIYGRRDQAAALSDIDEENT